MTERRTIRSFFSDEKPSLSPSDPIELERAAPMRPADWNRLCYAPRYIQTPLLETHSSVVSSTEHPAYVGVMRCGVEVFGM